jgi:tRNA modification GTPase
VYGSIFDGDKLLDDAVVIFYKSPSSFTGEDMAEIFCHGNPIIVNRIIKLLIRRGIRIAEPGEFTKRAFLNGKLDLTEAEAINHIVRARSEWEIDAAVRQMHGSLKERVSEVRDMLVELKADIECGIDFAEEDIEFVTGSEAIGRVEKIGAILSDVLMRCRLGERVSHGIDVPIVGKPNVGKSSILNLILNSERAIVSDIPGTTRDLIRETVQIGGIVVNLFDTAGIGPPGSEIEKIGIELSHKKIDTASIVIMVLDAAGGITPDDEKIIRRIADRQKLFLANKIDLVPDRSVGKLEEIAGMKVIPFSAKTGEGMKELEEAISDRLKTEFVEINNLFISDMRVINLLDHAIAESVAIRELLSNGEPAEIVAFGMQGLLDGLSEITGEISPDDVLNSIFSRFCIGK